MSGPHVQDAAGFSVAETARRVGVAASTLRTWERRYGLQPSLRTVGGHRRYTVDDVVALQRLRALIDAGLPTGSAAARVRPANDGVVAGEVVSLRSRASLVVRFTEAVEVMDRDESMRLALRIVAQLGPAAAWTEIFVPHLQAAGQRWADTGHGTEREHVGTFAIGFALQQHLHRKRVASAIRVVGVATPGEAHTLPLDALAAAAADLDIAVSVLGTLPPEGIHDALAQVRPAAVVVWARSEDTADLPLLRTLGRRAPVVCAAGPGWAPRRLPALVDYVNDLPGALAALQSWLG